MRADDLALAKGLVSEGLERKAVRDRLAPIFAVRLNKYEYETPQEARSELEKTIAEAFSGGAERRKSAVAIASDEDSTAYSETPATVQPFGALSLRPRILEDVEAELAALGFVGDTRPALILFLATVSRRLEKPVSVALKATSAAGKSFTVETVRRFFPDDAYYLATSMSPKALYRTGEPLAHRMIVIAEASGMENPQLAYLIRVLVSDRRIDHKTQEQTDGRGAWKPVSLRVEGPVGLITTTTRTRLHPENETRFFSVPVSDSPEHTREILIAIATEDGGRGTEHDLSAWHDLDRTMGDAPCRVGIPFGRKLAELVKPDGVRLRRDFRAVLDLVRAHALLHKGTRSVDSTGAIIATVDDYERVWLLVRDIVSSGVGSSVSETIRETVEAVVQLGNAKRSPITLTDVSKILKLDKSAASRRVRDALEAGFLANEEESRGRPMRLRVAEALPGEGEVLPRPEQLLEGKVPQPSGPPESEEFDVDW